MPNIVLRWDFEDGTTQGWVLGPYTSLDNTSKIQGTYSLKYSKFLSGSVSYTDLIASISNIDLSAVSKPILVVLVRDATGYGDANYPHRLRVVVKDASTTYIDVSVQLAFYSYNYYRVAVIDISPVAGKSGLTIELYENSYYKAIIYFGVTIIHYYDNIMILDGADYEYTTGIVLFDNEDKTVSASIPSNAQSVAGSSRIGIVLLTPDWDQVQTSVTVATDQGNVAIDSSSSNITHSNYLAPSTTPTTFSSISIRVWSLNKSGAYTAWIENVAVVFLDVNWNLLKLYIFTIYFTLNPSPQRYTNTIITTAYGTLVSGSKSIPIKLNGTAFDIAFRARYLYGDPSIVTTGSIKMEIFSSDLSTKYGELSIDITLGADQRTSYITGLPTNTGLVLRFTWTVQASARIIILVYPIVRVY